MVLGNVREELVREWFFSDVQHATEQVTTSPSLTSPHTVQRRQPPEHLPHSTARTHLLHAPEPSQSDSRLSNVRS